MSVSGLEVIDASVQKTNIWLKELMQKLGTEDRHQAYMALKVTLHQLRDRLSVEEAAQFGAQLPLIVRGLFYEGWQPSKHAERGATWETFMLPVYMAVCQTGDRSAEDVVAAVFQVLSGHVSGGEISDVVGQLPREIRALWPRDARALVR